MTNEERLKKIEQKLGLKPGPKKVKVTHYYLFGTRKALILSKVETIGDKDQWLNP